MNTPSPILKRPKLEQKNNDGDIEESLNEKSNENNGREEEDSIEEQKVAFIALIEHRSREVQHLKQRVSYYKAQVPSSSSSTSSIFKSLHFLFFPIKYCLFFAFFCCN